MKYICSVMGPVNTGRIYRYEDGSIRMFYENELPDVEILDLDFALSYAASRGAEIKSY